MIKSSRSVILILVSFLAISPVWADEFDAFSEFMESDNPSAKPAKKVEKNTETLSARIKRLKKEAQQSPPKYNKLVELSEALVEAKDLENAQKILWKYVDKIPSQGLHLLSEIHLTRKENERALKASTLATAKNENDAIAWTLTGRGRLLLKKEKEAIEAFNKAISIRPNYEAAYLPLIEHYKKKKNTYEVRILLQDMIKNIGPKPTYLTQLCQLNTDDRTYEQAMAFCRQAIEADPSIADNHTNLGVCQMYTENEELGIQTLSNAAKRFPKSDYAQIQYAQFLEKKKDFIQALNYYKRGAAANEKSSTAWLGVAKSAYDLLKYEEALGAFSKACKLDRSTAPSFRKAMITLRNASNKEWTAAYEKASDQCVFGN